MYNFNNQMYKSRLKYEVFLQTIFTTKKPLHLLWVIGEVGRLRWIHVVYVVMENFEAEITHFWADYSLRREAVRVYGGSIATNRRHRVV